MKEGAVEAAVVSLLIRSGEWVAARSCGTCCSLKSAGGPRAGQR